MFTLMTSLEERIAERARQDVEAFHADPLAFMCERLLNDLWMATPHGRVPNLLILDTPQVAASELVEIARQKELENGRSVYQVNCAGIGGAGNVLAEITEVLTGTLPEPVNGQRLILDLMHTLLSEFNAEEVWPRVIVTGIENAGDVHAIFGRLRDEIWQLPVQWLVSGKLEDVERYLVPPACSFFERVFPNRAVLAGVFGLHPHPYA